MGQTQRKKPQKGENLSKDKSVFPAQDLVFTFSPLFIEKGREGERQERVRSTVKPCPIRFRERERESLSLPKERERDLIMEKEREKLRVGGRRRGLCARKWLPRSNP